MGFFNKFLLFFYCLLIALLSLGTIVICTGLISTYDLWNTLLYLTGRTETVVGAVIVFLFSIEFMGSCFSGNHDKDMGREGISVHGEEGDVKISRSALLTYCTKLCTTAAGVRDAKVKVRFMRKGKGNEAFTKLRITLMLWQDYSAVTVADNVQKTIKKHLSDYMGLDNVVIDITVDNVAGTGKRKHVV